jgi:nitrite reductase/ring-hydroxylating ferredoxin subunit
MTVTKAKYEREYLGYSGLLIWVGMDGNYHAADLCCPHCLLKNKPVEVDGIYAICPQCEETYDLSYGYAFPTKGVAKETLRKYPTSYTGSMSGYILRIFN